MAKSIVVIGVALSMMLVSAAASRADAIDYVEFFTNCNGAVWVYSTSQYDVWVTITETEKCPYMCETDNRYSFWLDPGEWVFLGYKSSYGSTGICRISYSMRASY